MMTTWQIFLHQVCAASGANILCDMAWESRHMIAGKAHIGNGNFALSTIIAAGLLTHVFTAISRLDTRLGTVYTVMQNLGMAT